MKSHVLPSIPTIVKEEKKEVKNEVQSENDITDYIEYQRKLHKELDNCDLFDREKRWDILTKNERLNYVKNRHEQMKLPFQEREVISRTNEQMMSYFLYENGFDLQIQEDQEKNHHLNIVKSRPKNFYPEYTHTMGLIPNLPFHKQESLYEKGALDLSPYLKPKEEIPLEEYIFDSLETQNDISENVKQIFKLKNKKFNQEDELVMNEKLNIFDQESARRVISCIVGLYLAHEGFEGITENTLDLFTDIVEEFFKKFMKYLNLYHIYNSANTNMETSVLKVLGKMGTGSIQDLLGFHKERVDNLKTRLERLETKMRKTIPEVETPTTKRRKIKEE